jgi:hypothetical protein
MAATRSGKKNDESDQQTQRRNGVLDVETLTGEDEGTSSNGGEVESVGRVPSEGYKIRSESAISQTDGDERRKAHLGVQPWLVAHRSAVHETRKAPHCRRKKEAVSTGFC